MVNAAVRSYEGVSGHMPFGLHRMLPQPAAYMTMLRDPVESRDLGVLLRLIPRDSSRASDYEKMMLEEYIQLTPYANVQTDTYRRPGSRLRFSGRRLYRCDPQSGQGKPDQVTLLWSA